MGVSFRTRVYNVIAFNSPLNLDPEEPEHQRGVNEANELPANTVSSLRWAKPIARRSTHQKSVHLIVSFSNPEAANRAISQGIMICNKKCNAERVKRDPSAA
jgi:hypothetical protein